MERIQSIDSMKCIAIFIVVFFHTISFDGNVIEGSNIWLYAFPRFVIPFFFIVSGFLFGKKIRSHIDQENYFKAYILRLIRFFVCWYLFYMIYDFLIRIITAYYLGHDVKTAMFTYLTTLPKINVLYYGMGNTSYHLWFLTALIWSIIILFLFIKFKKLHFLLFISFILNMFGLFGQTYSGIFHLPIETRDALFFGLFYVTLGCFIAFNFEMVKQKISAIKSTIFLFLIILSSIIQIIESLITVLLFDGTKGGIGYYLSTIPLTISLFLLLIKNRNIVGPTWMTSFSKHIFGIYVTHLLFISLFVLGLHFFNTEWLRQYFAFNLLLTLIIIVVSHIFYTILQKMKYKMNLLIKKALWKERIKLVRG